MALKLFQSWAIAFESKPELKYLPEMYRELKNQGMSVCFVPCQPHSCPFRRQVPPTANKYPVASSHHGHTTYLDRLGRVHALPHTIHVHQPETPLSKLRPCL